MGRNANAAAEGTTDEQAAGPEDEATQAHDAYQAQLERLLAADVVLVPYGVLSQEVTLRSALTFFGCRCMYKVVSQECPCGRRACPATVTPSKKVVVPHAPMLYAPDCADLVLHAKAVR